MNILDETLDFLFSQAGVANRHVSSLHLNNYFTVVELDDASVGASFSDFRLGDTELSEIECAVQSNVRKDPLALRIGRQVVANDGVARSIRVAVTSALSAPFLATGGDSHFTVRRDFPRQFFNRVDYAVVIGFGGFLNHLVTCTTATRIHVSDFRYPMLRAEMEAKLATLRERRPDAHLSVSDGSDSLKHLRMADLVSISGSTLCNETLESLLAAAQSCKKIILQGQSASIHPKALFDKGIHLVATTLKPFELVRAAATDRTGRALQPFLEDGLPGIYLWPANPI
jgi:putative heavy-metal chelation protein